METINTIHGPMDKDLLFHRHTHIEDERESTHVDEYWVRGEDYTQPAIHRSVAMHLKLPAVFAEGEAAKIG